MIKATTAGGRASASSRVVRAAITERYALASCLALEEMTRLVSVAIPVRNGADVLEQTLAAVRAQRVDPSVSIELIVCDSASHDGSVSIARAYGAEVIEIPVERFSHGETRNLLMRRAQGEHVAFLTQDAVPADPGWLARLLEAFALAPDVGLVYGPYRPRDDASPMVARELTEWFHSFAPDGAPRIDRLAPSERTIPATELEGIRGFFTDANGCLARAAWEAVPFRADPVRRGSSARPGHAAGGLREGVRAAGARDPLARLLDDRLAAAELRRGEGAA